jgi:hypothetical protein
MSFHTFLLFCCNSCSSLLFSTYVVTNCDLYSSTTLASFLMISSFLFHLVYQKNKKTKTNKKKKRGEREGKREREEERREERREREDGEEKRERNDTRHVQSCFLSLKDQKLVP